jgi:hypothetical protein
VTFERAVELVEAKLAGPRQNVLKEFEGSRSRSWTAATDPYITDGSKNANLPKETRARGPDLGRSHRTAGGRTRTQGRQARRSVASGSTRQGAAKKSAAKKAAHPGKLPPKRPHASPDPRRLRVGRAPCWHSAVDQQAVVGIANTIWSAEVIRLVDLVPHRFFLDHRKPTGGHRSNEP